MSGDYQEFLDKKIHYGEYSGFDPLFMPSSLMDFQSYLVDWAVRKGRCAIFADCGLGKTLMQLVWAQNIVEKTNKNILILTPLAVANQTVKEGEKFGIECFKSDSGQPAGKISVTNYEKLHLFNPHDFVGIVCDESSILKNFDGKRKGQITQFARLMPYRLCCTATAAPNDYVELGTTSEAIGDLGYMDMLNRFFKNDNNTSDTKGQWRHGPIKWRFKHHAQQPFWQWVSSWARALRKPSDIGFQDNGFILPELIENTILIQNTKPLPGEMFVRPAIGLQEQRKEMRLTLEERCNKVAALVSNHNISVVWCSLNDEGDLLEKIIPNSIQISGSDSDEYKEMAISWFQGDQCICGHSSDKRVLITKARLTGFGLNWQHCNHMTFFPSHSFEQYYQGVRRCWRFGQKNPVTVDIVTTGGGLAVMENLKRKSEAAGVMFDSLVQYMNDAITFQKREFNEEVKIPAWFIDN